MNQGDIDNRLKTLFDALRYPKLPQELDDTPQDIAASPCYCLLSDDKFIDQLSVTTDRLLTPSPSAAADYVVVVIHVVASLFNHVMDVAPI
jgi:hypothetical protein